MSERFVRNNAANPMNPIPLPKQVPAKRALARLPGRKIFYADTGGEPPSGCRAREGVGLHGLLVHAVGYARIFD